MDMAWKRKIDAAPPPNKEAIKEFGEDLRREIERLEHKWL